MTAQVHQPDPEAILQIVALENPFPGLRPFREDEEHLFFGRESQVDRMVDKLAKTRLLAVVGTSGCGKSSLVNCGLRPALYRGLMSSTGTRWCIVRCTPGAMPIRSLARAFQDVGGKLAEFSAEGLSQTDAISATLRLNSLGLIDVFQFAHFEHGTNLLVIVDQFEELFRYRSTGAGMPESYGVSEEATAFVKLLLEAHAHPEYPIFIALTMRSDFLGECSQFDGLPEAINEGQYLVPRMTREERREAIAGPINVSGGELSPVLLTRLVNDVGDNPDQLSILQHAINRTWAHWKRETGGEGALSLEHYEAVGAMARALDLHGEESYAELPSNESRRVCERIFKALTDRGTDARGIRRPMPLKTLCEVTGLDRNAASEVINWLRMPSRSFLLPPITEELEPDTVIDISHEILMRVWQRLRTWSEEEALSANTYRRLVETAELHAQGKAALWRDPDLQMALDWQATENPNPAWATLYRDGYDKAVQFLASSNAASTLEKSTAEFQSRWNRIQFYLTILFAMLFLPAGFNSGEWLSPALRKYIENILKSQAIRKGAVFTGTTNFYDQVINGTPWALTALLCVLGYAAFAYIGFRVYRRIAYPAIAKAVSAKSAGRAQRELIGTATYSDAAVHPKLLLIVQPLQYAGFWYRFLAASINLAVLSFSWFVLMCLTSVTIAGFQLKSDNPIAIFVVFLYCLSIPVSPLVYRYWMTRTGLRGTIGEYICKTTLVDRDGNLAGFWRVFWRFIAAQGDWFMRVCSAGMISRICEEGIAHVLKKDWWVIPLGCTGLISVALQVFTRRKQALHDLVSGAFVVRRLR